MSEQIEKIEKGEKPQKRKFSAGEIVGVVLCVLLIPILLVNVTMIIKGVVNPGKYPSFAGYSPLIVLSPSMWPNIQEGDLIIVKSADPKDVKAGDVISFFDPDSRDNGVLTHRVVEVVNENGELSFRTKGDANNADDPTPVPAGNLIGIYRTKINGAGNIAMFLQSTPGLIVCVAIPLVLLIGTELLRRRKYEKSKNDDTAALLKELEELRAKQAKADAEKEKESDKAE